MTAKSRGSRAAASLIRASRPRICTECRHTFQTQSRPYAVATPTLKTLDSTPDITQQKIKDLPQISHHPDAPSYKTFTGVVLSRPPLVTPLQSEFEKAFYFYQKRLNERLVLPFTRYFYHKAGTPADADWKTKAKDRNWAPAKELGGYNPYDKDAAWHDELLVKDKAITEESHIRDLLIEDSKPRAAPGQEKEGEVAQLVDGEGEKSLLVTPLSRRTGSDEKRDVRKLDRKLDRTLYLVVKRANGGWGFPSAELVGRENLHQAAERVLVQAGGLNMNTWVVGRVPIGHHVLQPYKNTEDESKSTSGIKTFFLKARIMAGQANLTDNALGLEDFKWLTKEEVSKVVGNKYWSSVKNFLHDR